MQNALNYLNVELLRLNNILTRLAGEGWFLWAYTKYFRLSNGSTPIRVQTHFENQIPNFTSSSVLLPVA